MKEKIKEKCKFCKKEITKGSIRCMDCDFIWNEGRKFGEKTVKSTLRELFQHLNNLVCLE